MSSYTFEEARDLILDRFLDQVKLDAPLILETQDLPKIYWSNLDSKEQPPKDAPWFVATVQHTLGDQDTLAEVGSRKFRRAGLVTVQVFVPAGARGLTLADRLGKMTVDAFEGKSVGGIWFRQVTLTEVGPDGPWFQYNVVAEFTYEETK